MPEDRFSGFEVPWDEERDWTWSLGQETVLCPLISVLWLCYLTLWIGMRLAVGGGCLVWGVHREVGARQGTGMSIGQAGKTK